MAKTYGYTVDIINVKLLSLLFFVVALQVQYWVMTEVCREQEMIKRVALIKKFIKMAGQ